MVAATIMTSPPMSERGAENNVREEDEDKTDAR
jgi:hypothetical protein